MEKSERVKKLEDIILESSLGRAYADIVMNRWGDSKEVKENIYSKYTMLAKAIDDAYSVDEGEVEWKLMNKIKVIGDKEHSYYGYPIEMVEAISSNNNILKVGE